MSPWFAVENFLTDVLYLLSLPLGYIFQTSEYRLNVFPEGDVVFTVYPWAFWIFVMGFAVFVVKLIGGLFK